LLYGKNRLKEIVHPLIPPHIRFVRAGKSFLRGGEREVHELGRLVQPGTVVVDVGAHIGDYTYSLVRHVGSEGHVIAVEPLPDLAKMLTRATHRLKLPSLSSMRSIDRAWRRPVARTVVRGEAQGGLRDS
jgi:hypothetical protein